jgi:hypothetical protein
MNQHKGQYSLYCTIPTDTLMVIICNNLLPKMREILRDYLPARINTRQSTRHRRKTMNNKIYSHGMCLFRIIALVVMSVITFVGIASAQEETGKVQQGLVSGEEVSEKTQEAYGLLSLSGTCSASLLRNDWAISARTAWTQKMRMATPSPTGIGPDKMS